MWRLYVCKIISSACWKVSFKLSSYMCVCAALKVAEQATPTERNQKPISNISFLKHVKSESICLAVTIARWSINMRSHTSCLYYSEGWWWTNFHTFCNLPPFVYTHIFLSMRTRRGLFACSLMAALEKLLNPLLILYIYFCSSFKNRGIKLCGGKCKPIHDVWHE